MEGQLRCNCSRNEEAFSREFHELSRTSKLRSNSHNSAKRVLVDTKSI